MGIEADVHRQILGFKESANGLRVVLNNLYNRGSQEVLLGVFDGLTRLDTAFREIYPKTNVQHWEELQRTL